MGSAMPLNKLLMLIGALLLLAGLGLTYAPWLFSWFGRLPGDINIERGGARVHIPITSTLLLGAAITLLLNVFFKK